MKLISSLAVATLTWLVSSASAQLVLTGYHRPMPGEVGDPMQITLTIDPSTGGPSDPSYRAIATIERAGVVLPLGNPVDFTILLGPNRWGFRATTFGSNPGIDIHLNNTGPALPLSATSFPEGIPMSLFQVPRAEYLTTGPNGELRIETFVIRSYTGSFSAIATPVPEPSTYGLGAVALAGALLYWRRRSRHAHPLAAAADSGRAP